MNEYFKNKFITASFGDFFEAKLVCKIFGIRIYKCKFIKPFIKTFYKIDLR